MTESDGQLVALTRRWWIVLLVLAVTLVSAAVYTSRQQPVFLARSTVVVRPNTRVKGTSELLRSLDTLERRSVIATFARIPGTSGTRDSVGRRLEMDKREIRRYYIRASVVPNTNILHIDVRGPDPKKAAAVANAAASRTRRKARQLYRIYALDGLEKATAPRRPIYPNPQRNYVAAGILGLFLGIGAALIFDYLRRSTPVAARESRQPGDGPTTG